MNEEVLVCKLPLNWDYAMPEDMRRRGVTSAEFQRALFASIGCPEPDPLPPVYESFLINTEGYEVSLPEINK
jgi:hypothetical protein